MDAFSESQKNFQQEIIELKKSQDFISAGFEDFKNTIQDVIKEQKNMKRSLLEKDQIINDLTSRLINLEQYSRNSSIEIRDVAVEDQENV